MIDSSEENLYSNNVRLLTALQIDDHPLLDDFSYGDHTNRRYVSIDAVNQRIRIVKFTTRSKP